MAVTVWPVNAVAGEPAYSGKEQRQAMSPALAGATSARPLGARSGLRPGTPLATATSTTWTIPIHAGVLDVQTSATAGPYWYANDATVTGAVTAADATYARKDTLYAQLSDPEMSDGSTVPSVTFGYVAGAPAAVPAAPAAPARSLALWTISVPVSGGGSPTVTRAAPLAIAAGGIIPVLSQAERDTITYASADNPVYVHRLDTGDIERSVASGVWTIALRPDVPATQMTAFNSGWSGYATFPFNGVWYGRSGSIVTITGAVTKGTAVSAGDVLFTMPAGFRPVNTPAQGSSTSGVMPAVQTNGFVTAQAGGSVPFSFSIVYQAG